MKRVLFIIPLLGLVTALKAQEKTQKPAGLPHPYSVKWNPESLYFGKLALSGEYNYKKKKSIAFAIGIPMEYKQTVQIDKKDRVLAMKTFSIMGGYRMYMGKKTMTGFYFEPYVKYVKNDATGSFSATLGGSPVVFDAVSKYSGIGVGAQLGVQFRIAQRVVFDLFILGPEANSANHELVLHDIVSPLPWNSAQSADAQQQMDDFTKLPILGSHMKVTKDDNARTISSKYNGFLPGFRFGLSVGISF